MSYSEILTAHGLTVEQWEDDILTTYIGDLWFKKFMAKDEKGMNAVVQVKSDLTKKAGDAITIGLRGKMQGGKVTGNAKGKENAGKVDFYYVRQTVDNVRFVIKAEDIPMSQKRVSFDFLKEVKESLIEKAEEDTEDDIITALTGVSTGRVRGRYLYGAADSNWNATHATALTAIDNTADKLSLDMIDIGKRKATIPVNATSKIRPMRTKVGTDLEEWFVFIGHTYAVRDLVNFDATFKNAAYLLPAVSNRDSSPLFTGSAFKGNYNGVLVYDYDRIPLVSSTIQACHNLLLGAQAITLCWGQTSKYTDEGDDLGHDLYAEIHEIRGIGKLVFDRATPEDNGIVHIFSAAVAD